MASDKHLNVEKRGAVNKYSSIRKCNNKIALGPHPVRIYNDFLKS